MKLGESAVIKKEGGWYAAYIVLPGGKLGARVARKANLGAVVSKARGKGYGILFDEETAEPGT